MASNFVSSLLDSHELFVRNNRELCKGMKRERVSSAKPDRTHHVGSTTVPGVTSGRPRNYSEDSSSQSPGQSSRKRPLPLTAQQERDMLVTSQDMVTLALKQKLYRTTNAGTGKTDAPKKMKADFSRSQSEPNFMMSALDCDNRHVSSMDQDTSAISRLPTFQLREGYTNTSSSSIAANYTQDDMNLTYQAPVSSPPMYKLASDIHFKSTSSDVAFRVLSDCNNLIQQNPGSQVGVFVPPTHLRSLTTNPMDSSSTGIVSCDNRNVPTSHLSTGMHASGGNLMGLASSSQFRTEEDDSGSIGTIDDFDNMMG